MRARRAVVIAFVVLLTAVGVVAGSVLGARPASAGVTEQIDDYRSEITIATNGTIEVHETIVYDFGVVPHHGIYRDIPVRTSESPKDGYDRVYPLDVVSVSASAGRVRTTGSWEIPYRWSRSIALPTFSCASTTTSSGTPLSSARLKRITSSTVGAGARRSMNPYWIIQLSS